MKKGAEFGSCFCGPSTDLTPLGTFRLRLAYRPFVVDCLALAYSSSQRISRVILRSNFEIAIGA